MLYGCGVVDVGVGDVACVGGVAVVVVVVVVGGGGGGSWINPS